MSLANKINTKSFSGATMSECNDAYQDTFQWTICEVL
jgi:hypothetical protein